MCLRLIICDWIAHYRDHSHGNWISLSQKSLFHAGIASCWIYTIQISMLTGIFIVQVLFMRSYFWDFRMYLISNVGPVFTSLIIYLFAYLSMHDVGSHVRHNAHSGMSGRNFVELVLSLYFYMGPRNWIHVPCLLDMSFVLLSHFVNIWHIRKIEIVGSCEVL